MKSDQGPEKSDQGHGSRAFSKWQALFSSPGLRGGELMAHVLISLKIPHLQKSHLLSLLFCFRCFWIADLGPCQGSTQRVCHFEWLGCVG